MGLYLALKIYETFRSETVINNFSNLGIHLSYDQVLEFTKNYLMHRLKITKLTGVFSPNPLKKSIFEVFAKDNIAFNANTSAAVKHFQGTSMTVMKFPSAENVGNDNSLPKRTQLIDEQTKKVKF